MCNFRLLKIVYRSHTEYWVEQKVWFFIWAWWRKVTPGYLDDEKEAMQLMEELCTEKYFEFENENKL